MEHLNNEIHVKEKKIVDKDTLLDQRRNEYQKLLDDFRRKCEQIDTIK
jgi:phage shock protein A